MSDTPKINEEQPRKDFKVEEMDDAVENVSGGEGCDTSCCAECSN